MKTRTQRFLIWTPRILGLLFAGFISLFALDVFEGARGFWPTTLALLLHLIPTALLLGALAVAWRWEWVGALLFLGLGVTYAILARTHPAWIALLAGPLFLVGGLFLLNWHYRAELRTPSHPR